MSTERDIDAFMSFLQEVFVDNNGAAASAPPAVSAESPQPTYLPDLAATVTIISPPATPEARPTQLSEDSGGDGGCGEQKEGDAQPDTEMELGCPVTSVNIGGC